jgi:GTP diphosphokinase / guanosine-3',5'-bis(diphosphate) 3'-diphosphatase
MAIKDSKINKSAEDYSLKVTQARDELFRQIELRHSPEEIEQIKKAYFFAEKAHSDQTRKTGEPYITHPIAVARIINDELGLGANPIIAGLLHDIVEDTDYCSEDIRENFGEDVEKLVGVVTKQIKDKYVASKQVDNFNQMLNSFHYDIRALLVKLADRLHNMRTLKSMKVEKQIKIAGETDYFYAPLANRLGLYLVKSELENLSLKYRSPHEYARIEKQLSDYINAHTKSVEEWMEPIRKALYDNGINATVSCDPRSVYSLWYKMHQTKLTFKELEHIRIIQICYDAEKNNTISEKDQALRVYSILTDLYTEKPFSIINYIDMPKENGYKSLHCKLMGNEGRWMEVHIQSKEMRRVSRYGCLVERETGVEAWIAKFRDVLRDIADQSKDTQSLEDVVSSFYHDDIVVFAANGNKITLPKGATAIDFAYEIHSDVGEKAKYALINDKLCSIKTVLKRGDRVKIGTDNDANPKADWLRYAQTYRAKKHIRQYLNKQEQIDYTPYILCDDCHPLPGDEVVGFHRPDGSIFVHKCNCRQSILLSSQEGDVIEHVTLKPSTHRTYPVTLKINAVNRNNFLLDLMNEISNKLGLSIESIESYTNDEIIYCQIKLYVHSVEELNAAINDIQQLKNVYEVK